MRRTVLTLGGTVAGMAALVAMKFQPSPPVPLAGQTTAPSSTLAGAGQAAGSAVPAPAGAVQAQAGAKPSATAKPGAAKQAGTPRVFTGSVASTAYGPMQVQVTVAGGKITNVATLQQTDAGSYSSQIDSSAIPQLNHEALVAQSAKIHAVSGASYTSQGYIQSLQSALDQPGA